MAEEFSETDEMDTELNDEAPIEEQGPEAQTADVETAVADRDLRLAGLEEALGQRDARIAELEVALGEAQGVAQSRVEEIEAVSERLAQAVALYRASLLASEPDVPEDMVQGATVEAVQESLERARQMVAQVRGRLEAQASTERTPLGAPARSAPDMSALSPQEKILMGLSGR